MKKSIAFLSISAILSFVSCTKERVKGEGLISIQDRSISAFTGVNNSGSTTVYITQGAVFKVEVKGYSNLLPYYETRVSGGILQLGYRDGVNVRNDNTEVYITMPSLTHLQLAGSGNIDAAGNFSSTTDFTARIAGSGNIHIAQGASTNFYSFIEGSGNIAAAGFAASNAETTTSGSGNTELTVSNQLRVKITGSGNVYYHGSPSISTSITGSGAVIPK